VRARALGRDDLAGKTGTTNDQRDAWFNGYNPDLVAVTWVGRDDNQSVHLTGSSGAMTVWGELMARINPVPLVPPVPENIEWIRIDPASGLRADGKCPDARELPFIQGSGPKESAPCSTTPPTRTMKSWFERIFQ